jgi:hypothetical protein
MSYPGHEINFPTRTPAEERLMDHFWPSSCIGASPEYFRECIDLLKTVKGRETEIVNRLRGYLEYAKDPEVRKEIEGFMRTMAEKQSPTKTKRKK